MRPRPQSRCRVWGRQGEWGPARPQLARIATPGLCRVSSRQPMVPWAVMAQFPLSCFFHVFVQEASGPHATHCRWVLGVPSLHLVQVNISGPFQCFLLVVHLQRASCASSIFEGLHASAGPLLSSFLSSISSFNFTLQTTQRRPLSFAFRQSFSFFHS